MAELKGKGLNILPSHLQGDNGYSDLENHFFCWRWISRNDEQFRFVTLEGTAPDNKYQYLNMQIYPYNLAGTNGYEQEINSKSRFSWKYVTRDNQTFRVLVIVDTNIPVNVGSSGLIYPHQLVGTNDYANELNEQFKFCWRWVKCEGGAQYRGLTIE